MLPLLDYPLSLPLTEAAGLARGWGAGLVKSFLGDAKSSMGDAKSSLGDAKSSLGGR